MGKGDIQRINLRIFELLPRRRKDTRGYFHKIKDKKQKSGEVKISSYVRINFGFGD